MILEQLPGPKCVTVFLYTHLVTLLNYVATPLGLHCLTFKYD